VNILPVTSVKYELINIPNNTETYKKAVLLWLIEGHAKKTQVKEVKVHRYDLFNSLHRLSFDETQSFGSRLCLRFQARKVLTLVDPLDRAVLCQ
jgi:hypothetical protein